MKAEIQFQMGNSAIEKGSLDSRSAPVENVLDAK
jgi:hypothetical protein